VFVEGLNMVKRHQRPVAGRPNLQVGVIEKEGAIHVSNVAIVDPKTKKPTRVGVTRNEQGARVRVSRRSGVELD
jgi:large subunit ribosomal protein L24